MTITDLERLMFSDEIKKLLLPKMGKHHYKRLSKNLIEMLSTPAVFQISCSEQWNHDDVGYAIGYEVPSQRLFFWNKDRWELVVEFRQIPSKTEFNIPHTDSPM